MPRPAPFKPNAWQRFLSIVSFGLYKPAPGAPPARPPRRPEGASRPPSSALEHDHSGRGPSRPSGAGSRRRESRPVPSKPQVFSATSERIYVGNLSYDATESDLFELFSGVGTVKNAEVVYNRRSQRSKGYAFVEMQSLDEAKRAVTELHDKDYMGRKLVVSGAKARTGPESADDAPQAA
ncbi:MAG TPA: RNA-binding protein [Verrucomicrobiales bacterium]|nr:RNA-binding protein [Verrucomicrobiales bacterium]